MTRRIVRYLDLEPKYAEVVNIDNTEYAYEILGDVFENIARGEKIDLLRNLKILPPCTPSKIIGLAYNYYDLTEGKKMNPLIFLKSKETIITDSETIEISTKIEKIWVEVEIGVIVKNDLYLNDIESVTNSIFGYVIANDVTAQNIHNRDHHLAYSKSRKTFCPISQYITTDINTNSLNLRTWINGNLTQNSSSNKQILNAVESVYFINQHIPISKGDLIITGTPAGYELNQIKPGDIVKMEIEKLGTLSNIVIEK
jgi:2-keto-4-pentenoate hydratase/2-oxohepta-3-ene-1,7-dioic acid hydratase in catechol pathway